MSCPESEADGEGEGESEGGGDCSWSKRKADNEGCSKDTDDNEGECMLRGLTRIADSQ
jgi:hypothetical protein